MATVEYILHAAREYQDGQVFSATIDLPATENGQIDAQIDGSAMNGEGQRIKLSIELSHDNGTTWEQWAAISASSDHGPTKGDPLRPKILLPFTLEQAVVSRASIEVTGGPFVVGVASTVTYE